MRTLIHQFDDPRKLQVLEGSGAATDDAIIRAMSDETGPFLEMVWRRSNSQTGEESILLALSPVLINGRIERLVLNVKGDDSECSLFFEAGDKYGWGFSFELGSVDFVGWRSMTVDAAKPAEVWGDRKKQDAGGIAPPLQLHSLGLHLPATCNEVSLGLRTLEAEGDVELLPAGLA